MPRSLATGRQIRTVIIGGGGAGVPLAARLAQGGGRDVTLLEAGGEAWAAHPELRDGGLLRGAQPDHPANWAYPAELTPGHFTQLARGRALGGSTAINGGYFIRATRSDFDRWAQVGGPEWAYDRALSIFATMEDDLNFGTLPAHGTRGPMKIIRPPQSSPVAAAFRLAALELGFLDEPDKNSGDSPGIGPIPSNIIDGVRIHTAAAYLARPIERLRVRPSTRAFRVVLHREAGTAEEIRAVGVETTAGFIAADEVVLSAGAIASAQLLLLSGIGPSRQLTELGIPVHRDLPVGTSFSDHPNLALEWRTRRPVVDWDTGTSFSTALNFDAAAADPMLERRVEGDLEILLATKPLSFLLSGTRPAEEHLQFLIALQGHSGRGRLSLRDADPFTPPRIVYDYLRGAEDRQRLRAAVRTGVALLRTRAFADLFGGFTDLDDVTLSSNEALDQWIVSHLGTALHLSATAPMGQVTDGAGRVNGIAGLRVADTSILPAAPHRGPAHTAVFIGELIARQMISDAHGAR